MAFLIEIGTTIVAKLAEYMVEPVIRQAGYIICYNKNLKKLQNQVSDLVGARISMQHAVETEERKGKKIEKGVQNWLTEVDQLTKEADDFLKDEHHAETKCLQGFCPNLKLRHHLSRKSTKMAQEVAELYEKKKNFDNIAYAASQEEVCVAALQDYEAFDSRTSAAKDVINELRNSNTYMIGVYGIGGVGKTTLVKEVYKQLATGGEKLFDEVVMVLDLKKNPSINRIQKEIAEKLGLEILETETLAGRARRINNRIKDKKSLVILDDVWENIDLGDVGLPRMETLKILLTSRSKLVLSSDMGTQKEFPLEVLDKDEAWSLFQKTAGDIVKNPNIGTIATHVAEKCGGLPLLIVTVARSLRNSSLQAWKDTFRRLKRLDGKGLTEKTYSAIEWSYNQLGDEELKSLFLLCGHIMSGYSNTIYILDLFKYSMGLSLLKNVNTLAEALIALYSLLEKLKDSCLLLDGYANSNCRMHDLVGDVANRIMVRDNHIISSTLEDELKDWPDKDSLKKCTAISFPYTVIPRLPEVLECPELKMFILWSRDVTLEIPCNIFEKMEKLKVLDLTKLSFLPSLPPSLEFLKSLKTLCLDHCKLGDLSLVGQLGSLEFLSFKGSNFKQLPKEIGQLTCLRLLDLSGCSQLELIPPNVLSSLTRLEDLRMGNSFNQWEAEGVISTERSNASLEELKHLHQLIALQLHIPDDVILPVDLFTTKLETFQICIGSAWKWADVDETLNALKLKFTTSNELDQGLKMLLKRTEDLYLEDMEGVNHSILYELVTEGFQQLKHLHVQNNTDFAYIINGKVGFPNLTWLEVTGLNDLRFLFSSSTARSLLQLKRLQISGCQIMEAIVSIEEFNEIAEKLFCQLQDLELKDLPKLTKFCSRKYTEFSNPSSGRLQLEDCIKRNTIGDEIEEINSTGNLDVVIQHFLFDNKIEFPNLKKLSIDGLAKLTTVWNNQLSLESSKNLEGIKIVSCDSLKSIFPASVARSLLQLRSVEVQNCGVEQIVSKEDDVQTTPMFVFSKLTYVQFQDLPRLRSFYPGLHSSKWPSLVTLLVYDCTKVQIFADVRRELNNLCTPNKQSLFLLEKDSFPNLETLGLDVMENWDSLPLYLFRKLKYLCSYAYTNSSLNSLEKLLGLEKVNVSSNGEIHAVGDGTLPHLRQLYLCGMRKLMNLGEDNFGPACSYFPNLETLTLEDCDSLKNLRSSAISFKNITTLQVSRCKGLKYLISFSMAKSLMQLTKLEVQDCEEMIEILGSNENDDSENEVEFRMLKHLDLSALPSLRGFCSTTRIVKFPAMENLSMSSCTQLETFIFDSVGKSNTIGNDIKDTDSSENYETEVVQPFLFDNKVK
ncbi:putative P-loop containing nucleoside triphosphate hydrolase, leucine-rich repeat domain, L [Rosa chinensis]|uniref:Putative P-loop containing nucleoside triphosphate hydrolase, leucine-rich repeat domain, L n=1 Tax=Rosa chinensis TaxID=74649 RepID=A0A2P6QS64_ROSCH|nr:putative P-loop containing nucleoside triphosphate hydrolase, leucine-rich repeat domain, L [Rosa chinensis]